MSSLALGPGLEGLELWLGGLFTAAELAAADLLLQLSVAGAGGDDEAAESSTSATTYSSRRSAIPCLEDLAAEEEVEVKKRVVEEPAVSTELDRRARKRYRLLSDIYAATSPVTSALASASASASGAKKKTKKRMTRHHHGDSDDGLGSSSSEETRYGGEH